MSNEGQKRRNSSPEREQNRSPDTIRGNQDKAQHDQIQKMERVDEWPDPPEDPPSESSSKE